MTCGFETIDIRAAGESGGVERNCIAAGGAGPIHQRGDFSAQQVEHFQRNVCAHGKIEVDLRLRIERIGVVLIQRQQPHHRRRGIRRDSSHLGQIDRSLIEIRIIAGCKETVNGDPARINPAVAIGLGRGGDAHRNRGTPLMLECAQHLKGPVLSGDRSPSIEGENNTVAGRGHNGTNRGREINHPIGLIDAGPRVRRIRQRQRRNERRWCVINGLRLHRRKSQLKALITRDLEIGEYTGLIEAVRCIREAVDIGRGTRCDEDCGCDERQLVLRDVPGLIGSRWARIHVERAARVIGEFRSERHQRPAGHGNLGEAAHGAAEHGSR